MSANRQQTFGIVGILSLIVFIAVSGYIWWGFFYPDPFALRKFTPLYIAAISWGMRIIIPLIVLAVIGGYFGLKTGKIAGTNIALVIASLVLGALLLFPIGTTLHHSSSDIAGKIEKYHPYLQLIPPALTAHAVESSKDKLNIMCLGGSTTQYKDEQKFGWPGRVQKQLREHYQRQDIRVHNLGMQWYSTQHTLINYQQNLRQHKPDVIIVMHAINDLLHNADFSYFSGAAFREDYGHFYGPVKRIIKRESFAGSLLDKFSYFWYHKPRQVVDQHQFPGLASFERNLNTLIDLAETDGVGVVLMTQPCMIREDYTAKEAEKFYMINQEAIGPTKTWNVETALRGMQQYNDMVRRIAGERNVNLIDLEKFVPKSLSYFDDEVHYADPAFDLIGETVSEHLIRINIDQMKRSNEHQ